MNNELIILKNILNEFLTINTERASVEVVNQAMGIIGFISLPYLEYLECWYISTAHTICIDFTDGPATLFLEIGKTKLGYFTDGEYKTYQDKLDIDSVDNTRLAITLLNNDFSKAFKS